MLYVRNTNYSKFLFMKLRLKTDPSGITWIWKIKLTFDCTRSQWGAAHIALVWKSPYQQTANVSLRQRVRVIQGDHVIRASWWQDHATFINRSAINTNNKGQKPRQNQMWSPKMRICFPPEDTECSACHANTNYPHGLFGVGTSLPRDQITVVWQTERTLTRLCWSCGCCSEGSVGCSPLPRAATNNHDIKSVWPENQFILFRRQLHNWSKTPYLNNCFRCTSIKGFNRAISHLPVGLIVETVVISWIPPDR